MASLFRSERMSLVQLYIPYEVAKPTVSALGDLGIVQFRDLNPDINAFQRAFVSDIRRLDEMERKLRFLQLQAERTDISILEQPHLQASFRSPSNQEMDELEAGIAAHEARVLEMNANYGRLLKRWIELNEQKYVLRETAIFFQEAEGREEEYRRNSLEINADNSPLLRDISVMEGGGDEGHTLGFVAGVIDRERMPTFERILWRALRGNLYLNHAEIEDAIADPESDELVLKNVFVIFAHGREILAKIRKISESLGATLYPVDSTMEARREAALEVMGRLDDVQRVLDNTKQARRHELMTVAENLNAWMLMVRKEKAIYYTMNLFDYDRGGRSLVAEGWCPSDEIPAINYTLRTVSESAHAHVPSILNELATTKEPPTYHITNKVTAGFQAIVDAYGIARYREVNPGLFTIITFPFLFAVMFGDIGHGLIVCLIAGYLVYKEAELDRMKRDEMFDMVYGGRYILLLMGLFSVYTGFIYNDMFSQSLHVFHSGWAWTDVQANRTAQAVQVGVYPFGVDPAWHGAENNLLFTNSYKMKMSIVMGVIQMTLGILLSVFNHFQFKNRMSIYLEFIPQLVFLQSIFGYLCFLILYKWTVDWNATDVNGHPLHSSPPGLLNTLIFMFLQPGTVNPKDQLYAGQGPVQYALVMVALICVPIMLFGKPLYERYEWMQKKRAGYAPLQGSTQPEEDGDHRPNPAEQMEQEHEFDFSDAMVHQVIHTIEFCLGCISHTASYLRLWALSLAHSQLSIVLWDMTIRACYTSLPPHLMPFGLVVGFYMWFSLTLFILLLMEGLSAFLHAVRLHWVEFNSKFYNGTGHKFDPFSLRTITLGEEDVE